MKIKISPKKIRKILDKIPKFLTEYILLVLVFCFAGNVFTGLYIFYQYSFLSEVKEIKAEKKPLVIKEEILKNILKELDKKQERFQETEIREYPDLFEAKEIITGN